LAKLESDGWSRITLSDSDEDRMCTRWRAPFPRHLFRYKDFPDEFIWPIPIPKEPLAPDFTDWSPHLQFRTERCLSLKIHSPTEVGVAAGSPPDKIAEIDATGSHGKLFHLYDKQDSWAGLMDLGQCESPRTCIGQSLELITLSQCVAQTYINGPNRGTVPVSVETFLRELRYVEPLKMALLSKNQDLYCWNNVMWIEWEDGIAYRKAIGRVWAEVWERQDREKVDIVLG
jgi:hypothetical protein